MSLAQVGEVPEGRRAAEGGVEEVAERVGAELESRWDEAALATYLDALGPASSE